IPLKKAAIGFGSAGVAIMVFGTVLTLSVDSIAKSTGLGTSFAGTIFLAAATSLPEAVTGFQALRLRNANLVIAGIYGSNLFNLLIVYMTDFFYPGKSIFAKASMTHNISLFFSVILMVISLFAASKAQKGKGNKMLYSLPSILMLVLYGIGAYLMYMFR
ncbi:MAG: sodium:calcium antiporter, partial [Bacilli bacterium]